MRKRILVILMVLGPLFLSAQENSDASNPSTEKETKTRINEVGLLFPDITNLGNVGLTYRFGTNKAVWRINSFFLSGIQRSDESPYNNNNQTEDFNSFGAGFQFGRECRKALGKNFELRLGADVSFRYRNESRTTTNINDGNENRSETNIDSYTPGVNFVLGFNYVIKEQLIIGAEFLPGIQYSTDKENRKSYTNGSQFSDVSTTSNQLQYGFNNYSGLLSLSYRF